MAAGPTRPHATPPRRRRAFATTASRRGSHWGIGALLLIEITFGLLLDEIAPRGTPARAGIFARIAP